MMTFWVTQNADAGRLLCNGWKFIIIFQGADWEYYQNICHFPGPQGVPRMCPWCFACPHEGDDCWTHVGPDANWRLRIQTHEMYLEWCHDNNVEPADIFLIESLYFEGCLSDVLHAMDEGLVPEIIGNTMLEVMERGHWGGNQSLQAAGLDEHLKAWYKRTKETTKITGKITWTRVVSQGDWPFFKCKAAAGRHLVPYNLALAEEFDSGSTHDLTRRAVAQCLVDIYDILRAAPRFPSADQRSQLREKSQLLMQCYRNLSDEAIMAGEMRYKMKPKFHQSQHILEYDTWINPTYVWLYGDEDLQRVVKNVAASCHATNVPFMTLYKLSLERFFEQFGGSSEA